MFDLNRRLLLAGAPGFALTTLLPVSARASGPSRRPLSLTRD
ncbi:hypothetical protein [Polymorphobacter multimanifer]|nr:hypothetical protein [Polymorphobacter multimanifer]